MLLRFTATKSTSITNGRRDNLLSSGTLANMSLADSMQIFSLYNSTGFNETTASNDLSRILLYFDVDTIKANTYIPSSSAVKYFLNLYDIPHNETNPRNFKLVVHPLTRDFSTGNGLDIDNFTDEVPGPNWLSSTEGTLWTTPGGDYSLLPFFEQQFDNGVEDLNLDITTLMNSWRSGNIVNKGIIVKLTSSQEYSSQTYYVKKFSARGTQFFFNRPIIEARWSDAIFDDRNNSYMSSALATAADNLNALYLYNNIRGNFSDIPSVNQGNIFVDFYTQSITASNFVVGVTGSWVSTGIYSCNFYATSSELIDVWINSDGLQLFTNTIQLKSFNDDFYDDNDEMMVSMPNLRQSYGVNDFPRLDVFFKKRNWGPNIYIKSTGIQESEYIEKAFYKVKRILDDNTIIDFSTSSSVDYSRLSFDKDGNYFKLKMNLFEPNYMYQISFCTEILGRQILHKERFNFRVTE